MSDNAFEWALKALTIVMALIIIAGVALTIFTGISPVLFIIVAVILEIVGGGLLLYFWGRAYMARR